ncbi:hypothetical protein EON62_01725 [archaeon]|nr:MAG: hypothetical protein EON62_01725 [archaeon]
MHTPGRFNETASPLDSEHAGAKRASGFVSAAAMLHTPAKRARPEECGHDVIALDDEEERPIVMPACVVAVGSTSPHANSPAAGHGSSSRAVGTPSTASVSAPAPHAATTPQRATPPTPGNKPGGSASRGGTTPAANLLRYFARKE